MWKMENTTNNLGVSIVGDRLDFSETLQAIEYVVGPTGKRPCMAAAHVRVLKFCADMQMTVAKEHYAVNVLWPEAIFLAGALSGFIKFESEDLTKKTFIYDVISSPKVIFDENINKIRLLQSKIIHTLEKVISKPSFARILNIYGSGHTYFVDYTTQFLDLMNCEYVGLSKDKREQKLSAIAQNILSRSGKYSEVERQVLQLAKEKGCLPSVVKLNEMSYPDKLIW